MILKGSQRGGAAALARHLQRTDENDHVELHELRGFSADGSLSGALNEAAAIAKGTRCRQFLFSLSVNPPEDVSVSAEAFDAAIEQAEARLGLVDQPRAVVFHEKNGRRHAHVVWSRIDAESMRAINLPFYRRRLTALSRSLFLDHGWTLPDGFRQGGKPNPFNLTREEYQQARRTKQDGAQLKALFRECWAASDGVDAFRAALAEQGFCLARGDRRGFVALDYRGEVYSLSRWTGVKAKAVRETLGDPQGLPTVAETRQSIARRMTRRVRSYIAEVEGALEDHNAAIAFRRHRLREKQRAARERLQETQAIRWAKESGLRAGRFRQGIMGLWDRLTGKARQTAARNEWEAKASLERDRSERGTLITRQLSARRSLQNELNHLRNSAVAETAVLRADVAEFMALGGRETENDGAAMGVGLAAGRDESDRPTDAEIDL